MFYTQYSYIVYILCNPFIHGTQIQRINIYIVLSPNYLYNLVQYIVY